MPRRRNTAQEKRAHGSYRPSTARHTARLPRGAPRPPEWLEGEAKAEWTRVLRELKAAGAIANAHRGLLTTYCCVWAEFAEAKGRLPTPRLVEMRRLMAELGLTPKSGVEVLPEPSLEDSGRDELARHGGKVPHHAFLREKVVALSNTLRERPEVLPRGPKPEEPKS